MRLTRVAFKTWLESKKPRARVGLVGRCPLDVFFNHSVDDMMTNDAGTGSETYIIKGVSRALPEWAKQFVFDIDHNPGFWSAITAQRALRALETPGKTRDYMVHG